ncbi:unnamed protein product [Coccothraustes coccothraustes]
MGTVRDGGGVARGLLALLLVAFLVIETECKNDTEAGITSNRRIISRREVNCKEGEYDLENQCCKKCKSDVDLSSYIPGIVAEMTLAEVKTFVRHHGVPEPAIDQSIQDFPGDTSEQKIKLFRVWYQRNGMKGAYGTLISSLRKLKMCAVADKIEAKLKAAISSSQEGGQSYNPDTEQSKTCTQEGRNSDNESAELSKSLYC